MTSRRSKRTKKSSSSQRQDPKQPELDEPDLLEIGPDDDDLLAFEDTAQQRATIKVIGVGGGGGNAINTMIESNMSGVEFIAANTDAQALQYNRAMLKVQLGAEVTRGLGCGANPDRGRASALEARDRLREILEGTDMVFVTAGMGGGTGTGAAPIIAEVAREIGALTVGVVTKPFPFEGKVRSKHAEKGLDELHQVVDTLITIPNQRLLALAGKGTGIKDAFKLADEVLLNAVRGISDLITIHGLVNLDFADVRTVMNEAGVAMMGTGIGFGDTRALDAARQAISSPLLEDLSIDGARGVLINITGGSDLTLFEVNEASMMVQEAAHEEANIIFGAVIDDDIPEGELRVTVIATGLDEGTRRRSRDADLGTSETTPLSGMRPAAAEGSPMRNPAPPAPPGTNPPQRESPQTLLDDGSFVTPFAEDEYKMPAFLRSKGEDEEEDRDVPTFLRRAQD
jgi:cell division protein FtsZ